MTDPFSDVLALVRAKPVLVGAIHAGGRGAVSLAWILREMERESISIRIGAAIAAAQLREETPSIGELVEALGYGSGAPFGLAFKRHVGVALGAYRVRARGGTSAVVT